MNKNTEVKFILSGDRFDERFVILFSCYRAYPHKKHREGSHNRFTTVFIFDKKRFFDFYRLDRCTNIYRTTRLINPIEASMLRDIAKEVYVYDNDKGQDVVKWKKDDFIGVA